MIRIKPPRFVSGAFVSHRPALVFCGHIALLLARWPEETALWHFASFAFFPGFMKRTSPVLFRVVRSFCLDRKRVSGMVLIVYFNKPSLHQILVERRL